MTSADKETKSAKITGISSIIVAFILGCFNIYSTHLSISNNNKIQLSSIKHQNEQVEKSYKNTIESIKVEKNQEFLNKEKLLNEEKDKNYNYSVNLIKLKINNTVNNLDTLLRLLDDAYGKSNNFLFDYYLNNNFKIETILSYMENDLDDVNYEKYRFLSNHFSIKIINFYYIVDTINTTNHRFIELLQNQSISKLDNFTVGYLTKTLEMSQKELLKLIFEIKSLNTKYIFNEMSILTCDALLKGYETLDYIESLGKDQSMHPNKKYYDKVKIKLATLEKKSEKIYQDLLKKQKPLLNISIDSIFNFYHNK